MPNVALNMRDVQAALEEAVSYKCTGNGRWRRSMLDFVCLTKRVPLTKYSGIHYENLKKRGINYIHRIDFSGYTQIDSDNELKFLLRSDYFDKRSGFDNERLRFYDELDGVVAMLYDDVVSCNGEFYYIPSDFWSKLNELYKHVDECFGKSLKRLVIDPRTGVLYIGNITEDRRLIGISLAEDNMSERDTLFNNLSDLIVKADRSR